MCAAKSVMEKEFVCINCCNPMKELSKKYSNTIKTTHCDKCHKVADKYIEFESIIILVDAVLLSQQVFRHMIFNAQFKLYWKLSLVLLLLESFALWRKKRDDETSPYRDEIIHEKGFYICSLQNIADYFIITVLLLIISFILESQKVLTIGLKKFTLILLKAVAISNLSKIFILPILVWRENTTDIGRGIHYILVLGHHLCSLVLVFDVVINSVTAVDGGRRQWLAVLIAVPAYLLKDYLKGFVSSFIENHL